MIQDLELITTFMEKSLKKENVGTRSNHLKAHTICNNNQLLAKNEGIVAAIHLSQDPLCFMVKLRSLYWELINKILMDRNFIPLESKSGIDFYQYQYCKIPQAYEVNWAHPSQLWRKWWIQSRNTKRSIFDLNFLIRTRNSWYPIRDIVMDGQIICVKTLGFSIPLSDTDVVIWLQKREGSQRRLNGIHFKAKTNKKHIPASFRQNQSTPLAHVNPQVHHPEIHAWDKRQPHAHLTQATHFR